jgi:hypothetical protein
MRVNSVTYVPAAFLRLRPYTFIVGRPYTSLDRERTTMYDVTMNDSLPRLDIAQE